MSQPSPDARAVVRAVDDLTTQVRRLADAHTTPLDDAPTTPAPTCSAQYFGTDSLRQCIRAAHHKHPSHTDAHGFHWTDADAVYPADMRPAPAADEDQTLRWTRRESLLVLLTRLQRGRQLSEAEADTLRQHVETEIREADTARAEAQRQERLGLSAIRAAKKLLERRTKTLRERAEQAEAAIERVRALHDRLAEATDLAYPADLITRAAAAKRIATALDGTEQPTTEA